MVLLIYSFIFRLIALPLGVTLVLFPAHGTAASSQIDYTQLAVRDNGTTICTILRTFRIRRVTVFAR